MPATASPSEEELANDPRLIAVEELIRRAESCEHNARTYREQAADLKTTINEIPAVARASRPAGGPKPGLVIRLPSKPSSAADGAKDAGAPPSKVRGLLRPARHAPGFSTMARVHNRLVHPNEKCEGCQYVGSVMKDEAQNPDPGFWCGWCWHDFLKENFPKDYEALDEEEEVGKKSKLRLGMSVGKDSKEKGNSVVKKKEKKKKKVKVATSSSATDGDSSSGFLDEPCENRFCDFKANTNGNAKAWKGHCCEKCFLWALDKAKLVEIYEKEQTVQGCGLSVKRRRSLNNEDPEHGNECKRKVCRAPR